MQNGNALHILIEEAAVVLSAINMVAYYAAPLPDDIDERLRQVVTQFTVLTPEQRVRFLESLTSEQRSVFGIFGHRAATLAAREKSPDWLRSGLTGYVMANYTIPQGRQVMVGLAVYYHVARLLELNPVNLFEETAVYAAPEMAEEMLAYGRDGEISLHQYGWRELKTPDGLRYKFDPTS